MPYFAVTRERGPNWNGSRSLREQERWDEHAEFMERLIDEGFVLHGGPLGDGRLTLHMVRAENADEIEARLADDVWTGMDLLRTASIESWQILLGAPSDE
jgi:hypothetical protein